MKNEIVARWLLGIAITAVFAAIGFAWWQGKQGVIDLHATIPETGGWQPGEFTVKVGEPVTLRLTSDDVAHSFVIGKTNHTAVEILPGEVTEIELVFDKPGRYTYYCDRWCSVDHWRMRGTITVTGRSEAEITTAIQPLYVDLGIDIDAEHHAEKLPERMPNAAAFDATTTDVSRFSTREMYLSNSPESLWNAFRSESDFAHLSDQALWDAVAFVWASNTTPAAIQSASDLYARNCAACHGVNGAGDGVFARQPAAEMSADMNGHGIQAPSDFTDADHILALSPAAAQGKIIRGGMGTGMPMWGEIFTDEQIWDLISYIYTFQFKEDQ